MRPTNKAQTDLRRLGPAEQLAVKGSRPGVLGNLEGHRHGCPMLLHQHRLLEEDWPEGYGVDDGLDLLGPHENAAVVGDLIAGEEHKGGLVAVPALERAREIHCCVAEVHEEAGGYRSCTLEVLACGERALELAQAELERSEAPVLQGANRRRQRFRGDLTVSEPGEGPHGSP